MYLMYKNEKVAKINGNIFNHFDVIFNKDLLPIGTFTNNKVQEGLFIREWLKSRTVPNLRQNIDKIIEKTSISISEGFRLSLGVSLTDHYWFKPEDSILLWEDVNYQDNGFEPVFAKAILNSSPDNFKSPDYTTDGVMEKFWYLSGNELPMLSKIDTEYNNILTANEVVAFNIAKLLEIDTTPYIKGAIGNYLTADCPCFMENNYEYDYVNALQLKHNNLNNYTGRNDLSEYFNNKLGLNKEINDLKILDCLLHQEDRHERNIGILIKDQDLSTAKIVPFFDNGSCLGYYRTDKIDTSKDNLKFFNKKREDLVIEDIPDISIKDLIEIIKYTYEDYKIPEQNYEYAKEELTKGYEILMENKDKEYSIEKA